ncbi:MAG: nitrous oxide reductase accessory protein NosL [Pseudomonadota bacterium]
MMRLGFLLFGVAFLLAACGRSENAALPTPQEPTSRAVGYYCNMVVTEHPGPKGQIFLKGKTEPIWFSSVRDTFTYLGEEVVNEGELAAVWVNDMAQGSWDHPAAGAWVEARKAWYVVGSHMAAAMGGTEAVPFADRAAAEAFANQYGGEVADYEVARKKIEASPVGDAASEVSDAP